jgi:2,4-dienoyl-CoA reductase-like NADH-dependent reductase (Old Yellow Enzyme family)/thioredoxin reductase
VAGEAQRAAEPFGLAGLELRNRIVGTAHGRGIVEDGLALPEDAEYWRRRAAGGAAMLTVGGTVVSPDAVWRRRITTEAWRPEAVAGMALRAEAIRSEGAVAAAQIVHLGRETLGAETWYHPVAPSPVRSPREPTRPRALTDGEVDALVEWFRVSAVNAAEAGFQVVELHAAHGYLLGQFLSPATNLRPGAEAPEGRFEVVARIARAIRESAADLALGVRLSIEGGEEAGLTLDGLCELLPLADALFDYVNLTVGVRATYCKDMATASPPLLPDVERVRPLVSGPLLISHSFRRGSEIEAALAAGADLVGVARPLIADPDLPVKLLAGREAEVRPCVSCNEDCRAFDPVLLCSVNPDLAPPGEKRRPAAPFVVQPAPGDVRRVAIVGAGPAGLECAISLGAGTDVVVFDARDAIGGALAVAASAPNRSGWQALLGFYAAAIERADNVRLELATEVGADDLQGFDEIVVAIGSDEALPELPGSERALTASDAIARGAEALPPGTRLLVVDDGFGWWPCASAVELGIAAGCASITVATPGAAFGATLPPEGRAQLLARLRGAPLTVRPFTALTATGDGGAELRNVMSGESEELPADTVIIVGERRPRSWSALTPAKTGVQVIGDALVPRKAMHAISEGRAAAEAIQASVASGDAHERLAHGVP